MGLVSRKSPAGFRDYSLTGPEGKKAIEKGLAGAQWCVAVGNGGGAMHIHMHCVNVWPIYARLKQMQAKVSIVFRLMSCMSRDTRGQARVIGASFSHSENERRQQRVMYCSASVSLFWPAARPPHWCEPDSWKD